MVKIGTVWDDTVAAIAGRAAILASIAALLLFAPILARESIGLALGDAGVASLAKGILGIIGVVVTIWGTLAITAVASDPTTDRGTAIAIGARALPRALLAIVVLTLVALLLFAPAIVLLVASGFDVAAAARDAAQPDLSPGAVLGTALYSVVFLVFLCWAGARLFLLYPVILNERAGLNAVARSFALTRGMTWRIVGVLILYAIVFFVVLAAVTSVVGVVFRLLLGADSVATVAFVAAVAGAAVTAGFGVVQSTFATRLYVAVREARGGAAAAAS